MDEYQQAVQALPPFLSGPLARVGPRTAQQVHEVRLRAECPVWMNLSGRLCPAGQLPGCPEELARLRPTRDQLEEALYTLCGKSVHTHQAELAQGYLTLPGGHRVGVGGRYLDHPEEGVVLQKVYSLDLRIARAKKAVLPPRLETLLAGHFTGLLVVGEPDSGKTTLLRAMAAFLAGLGRAVAVIDQREELWPQGLAGQQPPLDRIAGLPKEKALQMALRTLAPQVVVLDELGGMEEVRGLEQGFFGGADCIASLHAASLEEAMRRPQVAYMMQQKMLRAVVVLAGRQDPGRISGVHLL